MAAEPKKRWYIREQWLTPAGTRVRISGEGDVYGTALADVRSKRPKGSIRLWQTRKES